MQNAKQIAKEVLLAHPLALGILTFAVAISLGLIRLTAMLRAIQ